MMKRAPTIPTLLYFIEFIEGLLQNKITLSLFMSMFFFMFSEIRFEKKTYEILNELFWALEDYEEDPELREKGGYLDEEQVREVARRVLEKLKNYFEELNR